MITDALLRVSDDQAVTTTAVSTNTIDLGVARDVGAGKPLFMNFNVTTAFAGGTSLKFEIISSASADLSSPTVLAATDAIVTASLVLGKREVLTVPPQVGSTGKRYLGARYTVVGTMSAGKVTTDVVETIQDQKSYASGFAVTV